MGISNVASSIYDTMKNKSYPLLLVTSKNIKSLASELINIANHVESVKINDGEHYLLAYLDTDFENVTDDIFKIVKKYANKKTGLISLNKSNYILVDTKGFSEEEKISEKIVADFLNKTAIDKDGDYDNVIFTQYNLNESVQNVYAKFLD